MIFPPPKLVKNIYIFIQNIINYYNLQEVRNILHIINKKTRKNEFLVIFFPKGVTSILRKIINYFRTEVKKGVQE